MISTDGRAPEGTSDILPSAQIRDLAPKKSPSSTRSSLWGGRLKNACLVEEGRVDRTKKVCQRCHNVGIVSVPNVAAGFQDPEARISNETCPRTSGRTHGGVLRGLLTLRLLMRFLHFNCN
jgi:hypothetical protein